MDTSPETMPAASPRPWFYRVAMLLMLIGVAAVLVEKRYEGAVAIAHKDTDESRNEVQQIIREAGVWQSLGLAAVVSAIVSWGIAVRRREKCRRAWMVIVCLLALYVLLELMMV
jgi:hypothetical protein